MKNQSLPHYSFLFLLLVLTSISNLQAQSLIAKNVSPGKTNFSNNAANEKISLAAGSNNAAPPNAATFTNKLTAEGLHFTENKGQVADLKGNVRPDILFTAHSGGAKLFLTANGISYQFSRQFVKKELEGKKDKLPAKFKHPDVDSTQFYRLDVKLVGANLHPEIIKEQEGTGIENFYLAHCPNGVLNVKNYSRIVYKNVYPNIDWVVYSKNKMLEYDFVINPGGKVSDIKLQYDGAEKISLDDKGAIIVNTRLGTVSEHKPVSFQQAGKEVESKFIVAGNILSFKVKNWDKTQTLTIDPNVIWATYYGGENADYSSFCAVDNSGSVYMAGTTNSTIGIASGGFQNNLNEGLDAFLVKFDASGSKLWATYYGGENLDWGYSCAIDKSGNVYLAGTTVSISGIASAGFQNVSGGYYEAFLVKFDALGNRLWGTYYGGLNVEYGFACTTDGSGNTYLTGYTDSNNDIASGGFQNTFGGGEDVFLVKFDASGYRLWATYYGGIDYDEGYSCAADGSGNVFLAGLTFSSSGIASGGFQNTYNDGEDAFLVKFDASGNRLWATYYGGDNYDEGYSCVTDGSGNVFLAGYTGSGSGIASNGFQNTYNQNQDAFLVKFDALGNRLWATYYGGDDYEEGTACTTDGSGNVFLTGYTQSVNDISLSGFQNIYGGRGDAFLVKFDALGNRLWATYYGGDDYDESYSCAIDAVGNIFLAGATASTNGIASGGFQNTYGGGEVDAFLVKISNYALPLQLLFFNGYFQNKTVNLVWQTVQEINTAYFIVEKSKDGINYFPIQQVAAAGSSATNTYTAVDNNPVTGKSLYRLKMVDKDGAFTYSNAVPITYIIKNLITVSPNPATDKLTVQVQSMSNGKASMQITAINGKIIIIKQLAVTAGINTFSIPVAKFAKGAYLLTVLQGNDKQTMKWVKE